MRLATRERPRSCTPFHVPSKPSKDPSLKKITQAQKRRLPGKKFLRFLADLSYAREMIIFSRVSAAAFFRPFFFARKRENFWVFFFDVLGCFLVFLFGHCLVFYGVFVLWGGVFFVFRALAQTKIGFLFRSQPSKTGDFLSAAFSRPRAGAPATKHGRSKTEDRPTPNQHFLHQKNQRRS